MPNEIKFYNPYSFIALNNQVFSLSEDKKKILDYSHDIPVKNSVSGYLDLKLKAETPLCVRQSDERNVNINGQFFIQGSSIKGMIRNVFEIVTLSNIKNNVQNSRYSMRDLDADAYELKDPAKHQKSGFIVQIDSEYFILPCEYEQLSYEEIAQYCKLSIDDLTEFKKANVINKYKSISDRFCHFENDETGMWFFSGPMSNKKHEFLFIIPSSVSKSKLIPIEEDVWQDFIFIHEHENENAAWKLWKNKIKNFKTIAEIDINGIAPCFFRKKKVNDKIKVKDLGFSFLYRQPYSKTIHDFIPNQCDSNNVDISQAVFGFTSKDMTLKGRVHFSHALIKNAKEIDRQTFTLGSPKPTFCPFYLEQKNKSEQNTYFSDNAVISGWKRYLVHQSVQKGSATNTRSESSFVPVDKDAFFTCKVTFHNLYPYELGALLLAITFNEDKGCFHSLGYAKPKGYGKLSVTNCNLFMPYEEKNFQKFILEFINELKTNNIDINAWNGMITQLQNLSKGIYSPVKPIEYPELKQFRIIKKNNNNLNDFSPQ